ncbi:MULTISPECIES: MFS transporter [unclassified Glutamicibacter]|uniref:MFS transporter n=1 Tax=unclassified Glutamicibacter TaxID=2627139 RepID=UPI00382CAA2D
MTSIQANDPSGTTAIITEPLPPLRVQRNYRMWLLADSTALLSGSIYGFIFPLILLSATGSPVLAGTLAAVGMAARASVNLAGGAMADRTDKARMILIGSFAGAAITAAMALGSSVGSLPVASLCLAHILMELRGGYFGSTTNAALKDLVHPKQLGRAMAANQGRDSVLMLGSAPLGGVLLGLGGGIALLIVSVLNLIAAASGFALRRPLRAAKLSGQDSNGTSNDSEEEVAHGILAGMHWCFSRPQLRALLILITVVNIGVNGLMTTLIYGLQQRSEEPWVIGLTSTFMGVGMLLGSLVATKLIDKFRSGLLTCTCLTILGVAMLLIGFNTNLLWMGTMLMISFLSVPALNAAVGGYFMASIPKQMSGRANSLITFMALAALPLSPLLTGFGLESVGMGPTLIFFGAFVSLAAVLAWLSPQVRRIPRPEHWMAASPELTSASAPQQSPAPTASTE